MGARGGAEGPSFRYRKSPSALLGGQVAPDRGRTAGGGGAERTVEIGLPTLYTLFDGDRYGEHLFELESATPGLTLYSATFG